MHPLHLNGCFFEIERDFVPKTAFFVVTLLFVLFMQLQDEKDLLDETR